MPNQFASGKFAIAECDRCAQRFMLKDLRIQTVKTRPYKVKVCQECWDPDHPQLQLGMYPVNDPQAVRDPRPDVSYLVSGDDVDGDPSGGSRIFQWGWSPVGGSRANDAGLTPNNLALRITLGSVNVVTT
jgi:hypothetical protein